MHTHMNRPNSSLDWVLSHWVHFTVFRFIFVYVQYVYVSVYYVFISVYYMFSIVTWWGGPGGIEAWSLGPLLPSVLWRCWLGHLTHKNLSPDMTYNVFSGTLNPAESVTHDSPMLNGVRTVTVTEFVDISVAAWTGTKSGFGFLVHSQVTIIFVVSVCLSVCLFVQSFSQPSLIRLRSN